MSEELDYARNERGLMHNRLDTAMHAKKGVKSRDETKNLCLEGMGYKVIRIGERAIKRSAKAIRFGSAERGDATMGDISKNFSRS